MNFATDDGGMIGYPRHHKSSSSSIHRQHEHNNYDHQHDHQPSIGKRRRNQPPPPPPPPQLHQHQHQISVTTPVSPSRHRHQHQQDQTTTTTTTRQTPPKSAQQYRGSIDSVARQERFREMQRGYYPASTATTTNGCHAYIPQDQHNQQKRFPIGLDYVNQEYDDDDDNDFRSPTPLVLDPSAVAPVGTPPTNSGTGGMPKAHQSRSITSNNNNKQSGMMHNILRGIGVSSSGGGLGRSSYGRHHQHPSSSSSASFSPSRNHHHHHQQTPPPRKHHHHQYNEHNHPPPQQQQLPPPLPPTATDLARIAPRAGFLQKLGTNIPTYKRRFFVLQPATQLYYFLSPNDTTPRGSIAIDETTVERLEDLPDGRSRFALHWPSTSSSSSKSSSMSMQFEARSSQVADEWCDSLEKQRLSFVRAQLEQTSQHLAEASGQIVDLNKQIDYYRHIEQDRDGAIEDAKKWKERFEQLDEAVRLLANHVRKLPPPSPPPKAPSSSSSHNNKDQGEENKTSDENISATGTVEEECKVKEVKSNSGEAQTDAADKNPGSDPLPHRAKTWNNPKEEDADQDRVDNDKAKEAPKTQTENDLTEEGDNAKTSNDNASTDGKTSENDENDDNNKSFTSSRRDVSLLDDDAATESAAAMLFEQNNIIEELNAPGQHFPALLNACQQLRENLRLASEEAATAVEDTKAAQDQAKTLQVRMTKAEKQLCQLWEENCSIRKTLKQKKREKRVLVREVKSLMEQQEQHQQQLQEQQQQHRLSLEQQQRNHQISQPVDVEDDTSTMVGSDEERLINELEEHVVSSIRLHEELVSGGSSVKGNNHQGGLLEPLVVAPKPRKLDDGCGIPSSSSTATTSVSTHSGLGRTMERQSTTSTNTTALVQHVTKKRARNPSSEEPQIASLFDRSASESDSEAEDDREEEFPTAQNGLITPGCKVGSSDPPTMPLQATSSEIGFPKPVYDDADGRSISSVVASFGGDSTCSGDRSRRSTPLRPDPMLQLDRSCEEEKLTHKVDESKHFKPINVAQRGQATSRLVCPLADVIKTKPNAKSLEGQTPTDDNRSHQEELQVYHLTFYTRKIGLQFQKVPAPATKSRGLLTDAMTADLAGETHGSSKTAAELKRVAAISTWAKSSSDDGHPGGRESDDTCLQVATPIDAVLVCGFEGFDDTGNNVRPKLGARLVAFDGVSVEVGRWTFDSIRKSIQARGRPLTLSFRNDFLTTDQRTIMTKAVAKIDKDPPQATPDALYDPVVQYRQHEEAGRPLSVPSLPSAPSHETDLFVNETTFRTSNVINLHDNGHPKWEGDDDDLTVSTTGYCSSDNHHPYQHYRPGMQQRRMTSSSGSYSRGGYTSYKSFSEAGSSASAISSALGPLMTNLMSGLSSEKKKTVNMAPDYLHRRASVETTPQHQDFQSNLL